MLFLKTLLFAAALEATHAQSTFHARQPYFPGACDANPPANSEIRKLEPTTLGSGRDSLTIEACIKVGNPCTAKADCQWPTKDECASVPSKGKPLSIPASADCIDGFCRYRHMPEKASCDCLAGCQFQTPSGRDVSCIENKCVAAPCASCGELPNNRKCCAPGVLGQNGRCFCATGAGEGCATNPGRCDSGSFNDTCCGKGTDNEGLCCSSGSCNGQCSHQPK